MNRSKTRTGPGKGPGRRTPHCTHGTLGRRGGGTCGYGRRSDKSWFRPLVSIVSSLIGGIAYLADSSVRKLSTGLNNSLLPGDSSRHSAASLPAQQHRSENVDQLQDTNRHLPQDNEESQLLADK